jgi:hypothetical protein
MANYYAVELPTFQPAMRNILSITQDVPALITTTFDGTNPGDHQYQTGLIVRLLIPYGFGMQQANQLSADITVINSTQFTMPINTTNMDAFVVPADNPGHFYTPAQVIPVGEVNELLTESTQNVLPYPLHQIE